MGRKKAPSKAKKPRVYGTQYSLTPGAKAILERMIENKARGLPSFTGIYPDSAPAPPTPASAALPKAPRKKKEKALAVKKPPPIKKLALAKNPRRTSLKRQLDIIKILFQAPDGLLIKEISKRLGMDKASVFTDLRGMDGLLVKRESIHGQKALRFWLTDYGRAMAKEHFASPPHVPA